MRSILFITVILAFASCSPQKRLQRIYDKHPEYAPRTYSDTIRIDSTKEVIKYRDSIVKVPVPGERVVDYVTIPCPEPIVNYVADTAKAETSLAKAKAWFDYPAVRLELIQKDTMIEVRLKNAIMERNVYKMLYEKVKSEKVVPVKKIPLTYKIAMWWTLLCLCSFVILLLIFFIKRKFK